MAALYTATPTDLVHTTDRPGQSSTDADAPTTSPWVRKAQQGTLPSRVASVTTDRRVVR